jgi:hypothetical protein
VRNCTSLPPMWRRCRVVRSTDVSVDSRTTLRCGSVKPRSSIKAYLLVRLICARKSARSRTRTCFSSALRLAGCIRGPWGAAGTRRCCFSSRSTDAPVEPRQPVTAHTRSMEVRRRGVRHASRRSLLPAGHALRVSLPRSPAALVLRSQGGSHANGTERDDDEVCEGAVSAPRPGHFLSQRHTHTATLTPPLTHRRV